MCLKTHFHIKTIKVLLPGKNVLLPGIITKLCSSGIAFWGVDIKIMHYMKNTTATKVNTSVLMAVIIITQFLSAFMSASVNIALPDIAQDFGMSAVESSWVVMAFLLSTGMFLVPFGKMGDIYGRMRLFLTGNMVFTVSSLFCALSSDEIMLIAARFSQGIGGAMIMSTGMAIVTSAFPPQQRGKMLGLVVSAVYLGLTAAPVLGGILTQAFGWRSIFIISVGLGITIVIAILSMVKAEWKEAGNEKFDIHGSVIYMISVFLLMSGFSMLPKVNGILMAASGVVGIGLFIAYELKVEHPVLNIRLFQNNRIFAFSNLAALINYAATFAITFILSLYLQYVKGLQPRDAGILLITQPAVMAATASFAGKLSDKVDPRFLSSLGMGIITVGLVFLCFLDSNTGNGLLIASLVIVGLGFGTFSSPNTNSVMGSVEKKYLGVAAATVSTMRVLGQIFSMAIATMVFYIFLGNSKISGTNLIEFMQSARVLFIIFAVLCFLGIFISSARSGKKPHR
jgi:EmrB/QacA subfamily drug resistance transporter